MFGYYNLPSAFEEFHDLRDKQYEIVSVKKRLLCYIFNTESSKKSQQRQRPCCNPVPTFHLYYVKIITQIIRGANTTQETFDVIYKLSQEIGKDPVEVAEAPGFVVNKILIPYCNEGVCVLQEGVASAEDIDIAMQLGCNHPMGPLHLGDLIGWDVVLNIMDVLFNETHDSKYRANVLIRKMVRAGKLGIKSGEGFFNYNK